MPLFNPKLIHRNPPLSAHLKKKEEQPIKPKKSNWRVKHENFLRMVRAGKAQKHGAALGSAGSYESNEADHKQQQSEENPDYILCDFCERRFSELAAERHIPICKESKRRRELRNGTARNSGKEEERKRRLAFKPPPLKKSQSNLKK